jgi:hypothetical protein
MCSTRESADAPYFPIRLIGCAYVFLFAVIYFRGDFAASLNASDTAGVALSSSLNVSAAVAASSANGAPPSKFSEHSLNVSATASIAISHDLGNTTGVSLSGSDSADAAAISAIVQVADHATRAGQHSDLCTRNSKTSWHWKDLIRPKLVIMGCSPVLIDEARQCLRDKHLVVIGDSVARFQYLNLAYFLVHGKYSGDTKPRSECTKDFGQIGGFYNITNSRLLGYEVCDCFRHHGE